MTLRIVLPLLALLSACGGSSNSSAPPPPPPAPSIQLSATAQNAIINANEIDVSAVLTGMTGTVSWSRTPEVGYLYSPNADNTVRYIPNVERSHPQTPQPITITATANGISKSIQLTLKEPLESSVLGALPASWTVTPGTEFSTISGSPVAMIGDGKGGYYISYSAPVSKVVRRAVDGSISDVAAIKNPSSLALGPDGSLYVTDSSGGNPSGYAVRVIGPDGAISTLTTTAPYVREQGTIDGPSGIATTEGLSLAVDRKGTVYATDLTGVRKIAKDGSWTTFAGSKCKRLIDCPVGYQVGADSPYIQSTGGAVIDADGNLYVTEVNKVRKITPAGVVTLLAGAANSETARDSSRLDATGAAARFRGTSGLTIDRDGNLFLFDLGVVRKISPTGVVTTLTGELNVFNPYRPEFNYRGISAADKGRVVLMDAMELRQYTLE